MALSRECGVENFAQILTYSDGSLDLVSLGLPAGLSLLLD